MTSVHPAAWPPAPLRTDRLVLRAAEARDRPAFVELFSSEEVGTYVGGAQPRAELERAMPEVPGQRPGVFVVELDGAMIGMVTLDPRDAERPGHVRPEGGEPELGYMFLPRAWGHGYASEACRAALGWCAAAHPGEQVVLTTQTANSRAVRVATKLGFTAAGRFEEYGAEQWFGIWSPPAPGPVTADDVALAVRLSVHTLGKVPADGWERPAGELTWSCWETVEHLADDLFAYALQLGPVTPPLTTHVPVSWRQERPDGPTSTVFVARTEGPAGLLQALEACGALLVAMVRVTAPEVRAHHGFGASDPEGFGAMGVVEALVHTHDVAAAFGLPWQPPADLCARTLHRLFPDAPADAEPWPALLWSTGRIELPGRARLEKWRWHGEPRG